MLSLPNHFFSLQTTIHLEKFEDTKAASRNRQLKKDRQHNDQKKKDKKTNNDLQDITQKNKYRISRTPLNIGSEFRCFGRVGSLCPHVAPILLLLSQTGDKLLLSWCWWRSVFLSNRPWLCCPYRIFAHEIQIKVNKKTFFLFKLYMFWLT